MDRIKARYSKPELKPATDEQIKKAQARLEEKRKQIEARKPAQEKPL